MTARQIVAHYRPLEADRHEDFDENGSLVKDTDDEHWQRKAQDADYLDVNGSYTGTEAALSDDIIANGVRNPVSLQRGGKRQVLGGQHRVAVMLQHRPDDPIPVRHFRSVEEAKSELGDKY